MDFEFIPITEENYAEAAQLHVAHGQEGTVETVAECMREARELALWRPVIIRADGEDVGFAMYGEWQYDGGRHVWLDRFFIDARHQHRGLATQVLPVLMERLGAEYGCKKLYLSVYETNEQAIRLYERFGFRFNGALDINGEKVMEAAL